MKTKEKKLETKEIEPSFRCMKFVVIPDWDSFFSRYELSDILEFFLIRIFPGFSLKKKKKIMVN